MCGIIGMVANNTASPTIYDGLTVLQHRGQDAAGIATCHARRLHMHKSMGLVRDVFADAKVMKALPGQMGIGHVRYPTAGTYRDVEAQPFYVNSPYGIALAHNGNLTNFEELQAALWQDDRRHINTGCDSEVLLNVFAHALEQQNPQHLMPEHIFAAVQEVHRRVRGAYACVALIVGHGIVGFRDPLGIRPLVYGERDQGDSHPEYLLASESVALDQLGFTCLGDVAPGEAVFITEAGQLHRKLCAEQTQLHPCIFEHVYLARPDSVMDGISVYKVRLKLGEALAAKISEQSFAQDIDVVMPIPDTSRPCALQLAHHLGVKYREGFVKNRYIGRTFIMPGQTVRKKSVRQKLNTVQLEFQGKNVLLVDDSIVRGTTSKEIIQMARDAGAKNVYFASSAPPVRFANVYGIDMRAANELIAHEHSVADIAKLIGADGLVFQELSALEEAARMGNAAIERFEDSIFTGNYITGDVDNQYLTRLAELRSSAAEA